MLLHEAHRLGIDAAGPLVPDPARISVWAHGGEDRFPDVVLATGAGVCSDDELVKVVLLDRRADVAHVEPRARSWRPPEVTRGEVGSSSW